MSKQTPIESASQEEEFRIDHLSFVLQRLSSLIQERRNTMDDSDIKEKSALEVLDEIMVQVERELSDVEESLIDVDRGESLRSVAELLKSREEYIRKYFSLDHTLISNVIKWEGSHANRVYLLKRVQQDLNRLQAELSATLNQLHRSQEQVIQAEKRIIGIQNSLSYKFGFFVTAPVRWVYDLFRTKRERRLSRGLPQKMDENAVIQATVEPEVLVNTPPQLELELPAYVKEKYRTDPDMKTIIYVSPHLPDFDTSSGGRRATRMLEMLAESFNVFVYTQGDRPDKYIRKIEEDGSRVILTSSMYKLKELLPQVDCIIYAWYYTYFDAAELRSTYPMASIVLDTVDVHWVREERSLGLHEDLTEEQVKFNKQREVEACSNANVIWTVTEEDKQAVLKEVPNADVRVVSNIHEMVAEEYEPPTDWNIMFIGGFRHYPNITAAKRLAYKIVPVIRESHPEVSCILAGSHMPDEILALDELDGIEVRGFIEEEDLDDFYKESAISVTPLEMGAGIKGKICEAIAYRLPVVTTDIGNEGLNLIDGEEGFISNKDKGLVSRINDIISGQYDLEEVTARAGEKMLALVGPEGVASSMWHTLFPPVSICIVTWNRLELVKRCIESVLEYTTYPNYRILVHSNGCEDGTQEFLAELQENEPRVEAILSKDNDVFVLPNNWMMDMYADHDVVLLNNDTYVTPKWLSGLQKAAYAQPNVGISGSKILYPDGTLQEFGSELYADGSGRNIGKWQNANDPQYNKIMDVGYVSGCSMYVRRVVLNKIGYFDEQFHPCYCEDSDLCYSAREEGFRTVVTHESVIYHEEGATSGTDTSSGFKAYQEINMKKFYEKHRNKDNGIDWTILKEQ